MSDPDLSLVERVGVIRAALCDCHTPEQTLAVLSFADPATLRVLLHPQAPPLSEVTEDVVREWARHTLVTRLVAYPDLHPELGGLRVVHVGTAPARLGEEHVFEVRSVDGQRIRQFVVSVAAAEVKPPAG